MPIFRRPLICENKMGFKYPICKHYQRVISLCWQQIIIAFFCRQPFTIILHQLFFESMLRRVDQWGTEEAGEQYRCIRDRNVLQIRKDKREDIFNHRRQKRQLSYHENDEEYVEVPPDYPITIIDAELEAYVQQLSSRQVKQADMHYFMECIESDQDLTILEGVMGFRCILTTKLPPSMEVVQMGAHRRLIELTSHKSAQIRLQSWWALANLAVGQNGQCEQMNKRGVIPSFLRALQQNNPILAEQGAWGLGNMCMDSIQLRNSIIQQEGLTLLIAAVYKFSNLKFTKEASWAIANLLRGDPLPQYQKVQQSVFLLCCLIQQNCFSDFEWTSDILNAIGVHCVGEERTSHEMHKIIQTRFYQGVIAFLRQKNRRLVRSSLKVITSFLTGGPEMISFMLKLKILNYLEQCLQHQSQQIRVYACYALSHIAAGNQKQVRYFISKKSLIELLLQMLFVDEVDVRAEILRIFTFLGQNCVDEDIQQFYVSNQIITALVELLKCEHDEYPVIVALQCLFNILERAQDSNNGVMILEAFERNHGYALLHRLQLSENGDIAYEVNKIVGRFIEQEDIDSVAI